MKVWIHINGIQEGPYELGQLPLNRIKSDTPVWYEGLDYWKEASQAPEVARLLSQMPVQDVDVEAEAETEPAITPVVTSVPEEAEVSVSEQTETVGEPVISQTIEHEEETPEEAAVEEGKAEAVEEETEPEVAVVEEEKKETPVLEEERHDAAAVITEEEEIIEKFDSGSGDSAENASQPQQSFVQEEYTGHSYAGQPYGQQPYGNQPYYHSGMYNPAQQNEEEATTYLVWAILITLLCCNPIGIVAIITAAVTRSRNKNYDYAGAKRMSEATAWWIMIAIVTSLIMAPFMSIISI